MTDTNHPMLDHMIQLDGDQPFEDRVQVYEKAGLEMSLYTPQQRAQLLIVVDQALANDEGTLRQRAQLLNLHRAMSDVDRKMKIAGR